MKIRVQVYATKIVDAPEFLRPYIAGKKPWDEMDILEIKEYSDFICQLAGKEDLVEDGEWEIAE